MWTIAKLVCKNITIVTCLCVVSTPFVQDFRAGFVELGTGLEV